MTQRDSEDLDSELEFVQQLFPSDANEPLLTDGVRMLASAGQYREVAHSIIQHIRAIAILASRRVETAPLLAFPTKRSIAEWQSRLHLGKSSNAQHHLDILFNRVLTSFTLTVKALIGFVNLPRDVRRAIRASRIIWQSKNNENAKLKLNLAVDALNRWHPKWLKNSPYRSSTFSNNAQSKLRSPTIVAVNTSPKGTKIFSIPRKLRSSVELPSRSWQQPPPSKPLDQPDKSENSNPCFDLWTTPKFNMPIQRHFVLAIKKVFDEFGFSEFKTSDLERGKYRIEVRTDWLSEMVSAGNIVSNDKPKSARKYHIKCN